MAKSLAIGSWRDVNTPSSQFDDAEESGRRADGGLEMTRSPGDGSTTSTRRRVGDAGVREGRRHVETGHGDPVVVDPVVDVDAIRLPDVVSTVGAGGEDDVGRCAPGAARRLGRK